MKQFPVIVAPFLLYLILREHGRKKAFVWLLLLIVAFLLVNGYFMIIGFGDFMHSMIENEIAPLIGVGFGPSQVSFLGYVNIPATYFSITMASIFAAFFVLYVFRYHSMKYALFAFPILIFLFNYRLFIQYVCYWMILSLLPMLDAIHEKESVLPNLTENHKLPSLSASKANKLLAILLVLILGSATGMIYHAGVQDSPGSFTVNSVHVTGYNATGFVDSMQVNITFNGGTVSNTPVLFRFILPEPIGNANMYLWQPANNITLTSGVATVLSIIPIYSIDQMPSNSSYQMIAYYDGIQGSFPS